jgi:hypothetical protein
MRPANASRVHPKVFVASRRSQNRVVATAASPDEDVKIFNREAVYAVGTSTRRGHATAAPGLAFRRARATVRCGAPRRDEPTRREFVPKRANVVWRPCEVEVDNRFLQIRALLRRRLKSWRHHARRRTRLLVPLEKPLRIADGAQRRVKRDRRRRPR